MTDVNVFVAFAAGIFSFLSPCVLPLIPSYLSFVSGVSLEEMRSEQARTRVRWPRRAQFPGFYRRFFLGVCFPRRIGEFSRQSFFKLSQCHSHSSVASSFCWSDFISSALFKIAALERYLQFNLKDKPAGYLGSVLVGITFAVAWTPCVGPILGATLALASTAGEVSRGTLLLTQLCRGPGSAVFFERAGDQFVFAILAAASPLYSSHPCRRRNALDHRRHPADHRLHDLAQHLRAALHPDWLLQRL